MHLNELAQRMKNVGDENRLKILCILFSQEGVCVSDIAEKMDMSVAIVSHHLQVLARDGIVFPVRDGKKVCYTLSKEPFIKDLKRFICKYK